VIEGRDDAPSSLPFGYGIKIRGHQMASLKNEIAQQRPFASVEEEALLNLMRTNDCIQRAFQRATREWGVTSTQYNVLRILRGAHPNGLTCTAIGSRMITADPDITRLLSRLKNLKFIRQQRDRHDRRVLWTHISESGLELLSQMDPVVKRTPRELLGHLTESELAELTRLLELARKNCVDGQSQVSCSGNESEEHLACDGATVQQQ
jgi:DNA-binding MarR family transcriptional regulator